jgi:hypothetical protein
LNIAGVAAVAPRAVKPGWPNLLNDQASPVEVLFIDVELHFIK